MSRIRFIIALAFLVVFWDIRPAKYVLKRPRRKIHP